MPASDRNRQQRLVTLCVVLMLVAAGAWVWYRTPERHSYADAKPPSVDPEIPLWLAEFERAKKLPEYQELMAMSSRQRPPLTRQEVTRLFELSRHRDHSIRLSTLKILVELPPYHRPAVVARLAEALRDPHVLVRMNTIQHIGRLEARECIPDLVPLLNGEYEDERTVAKRVLQKFGHPID